MSTTAVRPMGQVCMCANVHLHAFSIHYEEISPQNKYCCFASLLHCVWRKMSVPPCISFPFLKPDHETCQRCSVMWREQRGREGGKSGGEEKRKRKQEGNGVFLFSVEENA
ncbi:hypothetical protein F2P81_013525 [Scophthalmus maximus]|uniref:Uncharacterized protein n=1 Tax=Scophthalmus maximus TaxID=52904 RepID=A0A6A4SLH4_SCOMX|nr:hypothetical protein F2P81_013525 [Scophthalmus maximus]